MATSSPGTVSPIGFWSAAIGRFRIPFILLGSAMAYGTVGYILVERWDPLDALYMTLTTLTTVGYREVHPLTTAGRIFTMTLMMYGVIILFAVVAAVTQMIASGELGEPLRRRKMERRIDALRDHYVICAYGRVGRAAAEELQQQGVPFVVVEPLAELVPLMDEHGIPFMSADPTQEAVLKHAGIDRAKGLVCAVDSDAINVYITLTARVLNPKLSIVSRASSPESVDQLQRAGADRVVSPYVLSGKRMAFLALQPSVVEFFDMVTVAPNLRLEEVVIRPGSPLDGRTIGEAYEAYPEVKILAVKKIGADLIASPATDVQLAASDLVVALGAVKVLAELSG